MKGHAHLVIKCDMPVESGFGVLLSRRRFMQSIHAVSQVALEAAPRWGWATVLS